MQIVGKAMCWGHGLRDVVGAMRVIIVFVGCFHLLCARSATADPIWRALQHALRKHPRLTTVTVYVWASESFRSSRKRAAMVSLVRVWSTWSLFFLWRPSNRAYFFCRVHRIEIRAHTSVGRQ